MSASTALQSFLQQKAKSSGGRKSHPVNWEAKKQTWLEEIDQFYANIKKWLSGLEKKKLLSYLVSSLTIQEDYFGEYKVESLAILIGKQRVVFYPKGAVIVGAEGRIDIRGEKSARTVILRKGKWYAVGIGGKAGYVPFTPKSFQQILLEVME
ncbi:MAG: hypothetical protein NTX50_28600 [Candidatus Sumerlaeota bacterium]|nr:hypothetical protein [Candidatus Sumerlaeota bacterium]